MKRPLFNQVAIVGLGLIGGSLALGIRRRRLARRVIGFSRHQATIRAALARGAIHDGDTQLCPEWLRESDLVVIATPPGTVVPLARQIARLTKSSFILTDVASTKKEIVRGLEKLPSRISVVGSHPMAGSERSGIEAAQPDLFEGAPCVVTRTPRTNAASLKKVDRLWRSVGGRVRRMSPSRHDALVAEVSHAAHLAAAGLLLASSSKALPLAAGGFSDMTRVALSDPKLWSEIAKTNPKEIARSLNQLVKKLKFLQELVASGKMSALKKQLALAQQRRRQIKR